MNIGLSEHTILLTIAGSRAHGLHSQASDVDLKGVLIPPAPFFHGYRHHLDQIDDAAQVQTFHPLLTDAEQTACKLTKLEGSVYEIRKFIRLASDCNPNLLEVLFCRDSEIRKITPLGEKLREHRQLFLSSRARFTFSGYAAAQLRRIKGHRQWLLNPPKAKPTRSQFQLPNRTLIPADQLAAAESAIQKKIDGWEIDYGDLQRSSVLKLNDNIAKYLSEISCTAENRWQNAARGIGYDENFMVLLDRERRYKGAMRNWSSFQTWKKHRNPKRAELEKKYGYDCKHASHLVRLLRLGHEILSTGTVHVWRGGIDAEELRAIRRGAWTYEQLIAWVEQEESKIDRCYREKTHCVPNSPNADALNHLCQELVEARLKD